MNIRFIHADFGSPHYQAACRLREDVLRKPLGIPLREADTKDDEQEDLFCALMDDRVVACLQLKPVDAATMRLRQMAVEPALQKAGVGSALVRFAEHWAMQHGIAAIVLDARVQVVRFYEILGYAAEGDEFVSVGIPHRRMRKALRSP